MIAVFGPDARLTRAGEVVVRLLNALLILAVAFGLGYGLVAAAKYGQDTRCARLATSDPATFDRDCGWYR